jgi:hypothetical protein
VATVRIRPFQHATSAYRLRGVAVTVLAPHTGLLFIRVRDTRGRMLAHGVEPFFRSREFVRVPITRTGLAVLRHGHRMRVRVSATFRDLLGATARLKSADGALR